MFGKKKKDKTIENLIHPIFGEMKYLGVGWEVSKKITFELWGKGYEIPLGFIADNQKDKITEKQEAAFEKLKNVISGQKSEIEKAILVYAKTDNEEKLVHRFIPSHIAFSKKGECALFVEDIDEDGAYNDETNTAFALFLVPKIFLYTPEDSLDFILGGGGFLDDELYGRKENTN